MTPDRTPATVRGHCAPTPRLTWQAALLVALGLSSAFLLVLAGFAAATTLLWSG